MKIQLQLYGLCTYRKLLFWPVLPSCNPSHQPWPGESISHACLILPLPFFRAPDCPADESQSFLRAYVFWHSLSPIHLSALSLHCPWHTLYISQMEYISLSCTQHMIFCFSGLPTSTPSVWLITFSYSSLSIYVTFPQEAFANRLPIITKHTCELYQGREVLVKALVDGLLVC
jgi:hypothetical protein